MTTLVQSKYAQLTGTGVSAVLDATPALGNLLVAVLTSTGSIAGATHPWSQAPEVSAGVAGNEPLIRMYSKTAGASESTTVSFSNTSSRSFTLTVFEVSPTLSGATWALDEQAAATGTVVTTLTIGPTAALDAADEVAFAALSFNGAPNTAPNLSDGFTIAGAPGTTARGFAGHKVLASAAAVSTASTWASGRNCAGAVATYRQSGGAAGQQNSRFLSML